MITAEALQTDWLASLLPVDVDYCSIRYMVETSEQIRVRNGVVEPIRSGIEGGILVNVWHAGGTGYAATPDVSDAGIRSAIDTARNWAAATAGKTAATTPTPSGASGSYSSPVDRAWDASSLSDRVALVADAASQLAIDDRIVESYAAVTDRRIETIFVDTAGAVIRQTQQHFMPDMRAIAHDKGLTQSRSLGGFALMAQGGAEVLDRFGFAEAASQLPEEALELLAAPNCPDGVRDLVLTPDQMVLQIHESIGHPLELDRILGDERNFAGTSFVTADMFGTFQYGSPLLNVTFDPSVHGELASYAFDDEGTPAERQFLIRDGILERPLGGALSQQRAGMEGVANSRSSAWNRAPIDRMANLNVEPGDTSYDDMIADIDNGILMETNVSWSIDDSRNKFQFSCEKGTLIENGELTTVVRNPSYRGVSKSFWRSLAAVGDRDSFEVLGVPNCGKGEPSQVIWVGHASPPCRFNDIDVFGAAS